MAKQKIRYIRARDKKGRFVSGTDLRRAVKREIWEKTKRGKVKKIYEQLEFKPLKRSEFKTRFQSRLLETTTPDIYLSKNISFNRSRNRFVENTIARSGFFDEIISSVARNRSPKLNFKIDINDLVLWDGRQYPDTKNMNFAYNLNPEEMQSILDGDVDEIEKQLENIRNKLMGTIKYRFKELGIQFSAKQYRNYDPRTGNKKRGGKKRKSVRSFNISVKVEAWKS